MITAHYDDEYNGTVKISATPPIRDGCGSGYRPPTVYFDGQLVIGGLYAKSYTYQEAVQHCFATISIKGKTKEERKAWLIKNGVL